MIPAGERVCKLRFFILNIAALFFCFLAAGQPGLLNNLPAVLDNDHPDYIACKLRQEASVKSSLCRLPENKQDWEKYKTVLKEEIIKRTGAILGQNLSLNMKVTGSVSGKGFTVKNILFQTRPEIYATANLYIPDGEGKFPAVLVMMGHSPNGRFYKNYQAVALNLVSHGYVTLCIDPWGAGERTTKHGIFEDHGDENNLGSALLDVGETLMGLQITDNVRAVDLLCSLPYVDSEKIGATGSSGGGNQTMWLSALDERVKAAVPVVSAGTFESYMLGSPCICEVLPGGLNVTEEAGILALIAPRAVKLVNHAQDNNLSFLPVEMKRSLKDAQPVFKMLNAEKNISCQVFDLPHGYFPEDREVMLGWFDLWLKGIGAGSPVQSFLPDTISTEKLMTYASGKRDSSIISTEVFSKRKGIELRNVFLVNDSFETESKRTELRNLLGVNEKSLLLQAHSCSSVNGWERLALEISDGKVLPVLMKEPANNSGQYMIICSTAGKNSIPSELIGKYAKSGAGIALIDLSGIGESSSAETLKHDSNGNLRTLSRSELWLGRTLIGDWEEELEVLTQYLESECKAQKVSVDGTKEAGLAALFMAALKGNIDSLILRDIPISYLFDTRENIDYFSMAIHIPGILKWGDVSLAAALSGINISLINPVTMSGREPDEIELNQFKSESEQFRKKCRTGGSIDFSFSTSTN
jgi:hypothetical protein